MSTLSICHYIRNLVVFRNRNKWPAFEPTVNRPTVGLIYRVSRTAAAATGNQYANMFTFIITSKNWKIHTHTHMLSHQGDRKLVLGGHSWISDDATTAIWNVQLSPETLKLGGD